MTTLALKYARSHIVKNSDTCAGNCSTGRPLKCLPQTSYPPDSARLAKRPFRRCAVQMNGSARLEAYCAPALLAECNQHGTQRHERDTQPVASGQSLAEEDYTKDRHEKQTELVDGRNP